MHILYTRATYFSLALIRCGAACHEYLVLKGCGAPSLNVGDGKPCAGASWGVFALKAP